ncbi:MAG: hypothetical protein J6B68_01860 [Lachnospiraceae bacterium]|nr:hypothetical protein [Lachnospiraceae bacterium]MBP3477593.1 hypothetical protein [Lachnospiraceae bacterium]
MSIESLGIVSEFMESLGLNYEFMEWTSDPVYPYFVGEYQEIPQPNEDGEEESTFILTGFSRDSWIQLEEAKEKIKEHFSKVGKIVTTESNSAMAIFYANSFPIQTGDAELKKIQINLTVKEWSVN